MYLSISCDKIVRILLLLSFAELTIAKDYCSINCRDHVHSVCQRKHQCGPINGCITIESDVAFREHMVKAHNEFRNKIASGSMKGPYGNMGATNMKAISYDLELEYIATCWNNVCNQLKHDDCRDTDRFMVGQNIWWGMGMNETSSAVPDWFNEIQYFTDPNWLARFSDSNYPNDGNQRGHFTQIIWADTQYIGCSRVRFGQSRETQLICNYGPSGNVIGMPIYKMADDASKIAKDCPDGVNSKYSALCGSIDPIPTSKSASGNLQIFRTFI
ncbi:hypothetical protein WA026_021977 [Henosepilachna vigintioctopunctata]|uniref:SCP domain-containing protein n=1 Tax=Henosepilachna vigintioctopunctata TaxID=420089 RepID=A0AAW1VIL5_9CUCU